MLLSSTPPTLTGTVTLKPCAEALTAVAPMRTPVTRPVLSTVATVVSAEVQLTPLMLPTVQRPVEQFTPEVVPGGVV